MRLGRRFSLWAGALALGLATLSAVVSYHLAYRDAERDAKATLAGLVEAVKNTTAVGAYAGDTVLLDEVANGLIRHPMVGSVQIELATGAQVQRQQRTEPAPGDTPRIAVPLASPFDAHETLGHVRVVAEPDALALDARRQALRASLPLFAQVLLLTLLLNLLAARLLSRPMERLAAQVAALEPGTAERLVVPARHQRDEIGRLVRRTNDLLQANATALDRERELRDEVGAIGGQLQRLLNASSAAIFLLDADGQLLRGNATLVRLCTGAPGDALPAGRFAHDHFHTPEALLDLLRRALQEGQPQSADLRLRRGTDDGTEHWVHVLLSPLDGDDGTPLVEGVLYDVTQRRHEELRAQHQALHDPLTGLRNRAGLHAELDRAIAAVRVSGGGLSLLYLDLDGFKAVNDQRGHDAGDVVLREIAQRLVHQVRRSGDLAARLGGDEFVLLLRAEPDAPWVVELAWRLTRVLAEPIDLPDGGAPARVGASVGIAGLPRDAHGRDELLRQADAAMYAVKHAGKNGVATPRGPLPPPTEPDASV